MPPTPFRARTPVERNGAEFYILLLLLSFAASVSLTRLFLELTGYPQIGNATLHIAHLLWGGLLLFIAVMLMLIFANRWAYRWGALLAGAGIGLFIDEVGKFITQTNDYFFPPAAPIIYAFFLIVVMLYLQIRRPNRLEPRAELYRVFDAMEEVLERDLDEVERASLEARLHFIIEHPDDPEQAHLANELLDYLHKARVIPRVPGWWEQIAKYLHDLDLRWITQARLRAILAAGLGIMGVWAMRDLAQWIFDIASKSPVHLEQLLQKLIAAGRLSSATGLAWLATETALKAGLGLILVISAVLLINHRIRIGFFGLLLFLTGVDLLEFYFDQFATIPVALVQFTLLLILLHYRRRFITS
jgi:hypothetical protein